MNDILAPIFVVFLADNLKASYLELENGFNEFSGQISEELYNNVG